MTTLEEARSEIARLTRALHDREAHPDFEYETTRTARKSGETLAPEGEGWEPNLRVTCGVTDRRHWDRFEFHEEEYWMRRKVESRG